MKRGTSGSTLGGHLRATRLLAEKTLAQVAKASGLSVSYLSDVERGRRSFLFKHFEALSKPLPRLNAKIVSHLMGYCERCGRGGGA